MLRSFDGKEPQIAESAYVDPAAVVIGDVRIGPDASIWPNAVLRGDIGTIEIGEGANVQDNATLHEDAVLEPFVTVGHGAVVHDATVRERSLIGMNAVVLDDAVIGEKSIVAAGSVVTEGTAVPSGVLVAGAPAKVKFELDDSGWFAAGDRYVELSKRHAETSQLLPDEGFSGTEY